MNRWLSFVLLLTLCLAGPASAIYTPQAAAKEPAPTAQFVLPTVKRDSLLNGLQIGVIEQRGTGSVSARVRVNSGAMFDLAGKSGLADLTAGMLLKGGGGLTAKNLAETVEQAGLKVNVLAGWDATDIVFSGPADTLDIIFDLLNRLIINPAFDQKELDSVKAMRLAELNQGAKATPEIVRRKALESLYGTHPYGRPARGTAETVAKITRPDVLFYHNRYYLANNAVLLVTGDASAEGVTSLARSKLGSWKKGEKIPATFRPPEAHSARRIIILDQPDAPAAQAAVAQIGISRRQEDYFAAALLSDLVKTALAKKAAATPDATFNLESDARYLNGPLLVEANTTLENLCRTLDSVFATMSQLQKEPPPPDLLEAAKSRMFSALAEKLRTNEGAADIILDIELYGLGRDYLIHYADRVNAVTADDIRRAAQKNLSPDSAVVVVAGPAGKLEEALKKFGAVAVVR